MRQAKFAPHLHARSVQQAKGRATSARLITVDQIPNYDTWDKLPLALQGLETRMILIGPEGWLFHLHGRDAGKEGVRLAGALKGDYHLPFELITTEGAYQMGVTIERVNYTKRMMSAGIMVGGDTPVQMTNFQYRWAEDRFWGQGLREDADSWLGVYTRFTGWRWTQIRLNSPVGTAQKLDTVANGNNFAQWDLDIIGTRPYFAKPALYDTWYASHTLKGVDNNNDGHDDVVSTPDGIITLANRGDMESRVKFLVTGTGQCSVQDNDSDRMVPLPYIYKEDGPWVAVDTDPEEMPLATPADPVDTQFYAILRSSKLLQDILHNSGSQGTPMWKRFDKRFYYSVPPRTVVHLRVAHNNPNATITAILPQHYKRSR